MRTYLTFGDIEGKLDVLVGRMHALPGKGRYSGGELIAKYGRSPAGFRPHWPGPSIYVRN